MKSAVLLLSVLLSPLLSPCEGFATKATDSACPENINSLKTADFLTQEFKWKAPPTKEGEDAPALPELTCKESGQISVAGQMTPVFQVGLQGQKKKVAILATTPTPVFLRAEPKAMMDANQKAFVAALPIAKDITRWAQILKTEFEVIDNDVCGRTQGPEGVIKGEALTCAKSTKTTKTPVKIELGSAIKNANTAQKAALKEFARVEKEEEIPDAKEIFGDKDNVWRLVLGKDPQSTYYVYWMSQFSASGVIVAAYFMDGTIKSEVVTNSFEYDQKVVNRLIQKWTK